MSLGLLFVHMGTMAAALITSRLLDNWARPMVHVAVSTIIMAFSRILIIDLFRGVDVVLGMFIYLLAVNGMTIVQSIAVTKKSQIYPVLSGAFMSVLGFSFVMFFVAAIREYFGSGTLWGIPMPSPGRLPGMTLPFFGFIMMGFLLAGTKLINKKMFALAVIKRQRREERFIAVEEI